MLNYKNILLIISVLFAQASASDTPSLNLQLTDSNHVVITYTLDKPATRLAFKRNPDVSRLSRWKPISDAFQMYTEAGDEYVSRKDQSEFTRVETEVPTSYTDLRADYAPFQPFSDGACSYTAHDSLLVAGSVANPITLGEYPLRLLRTLLLS